MLSEIWSFDYMKDLNSAVISLILRFSKESDGAKYSSGGGLHTPYNCGYVILIHTTKWFAVVDR